jgi:hypothetical protein
MVSWSVNARNGSNAGIGVTTRVCEVWCLSPLEDCRTSQTMLRTEGR